MRNLFRTGAILAGLTQSTTFAFATFQTLRASRSSLHVTSKVEFEGATEKSRSVKAASDDRTFLQQSSPKLDRRKALSALSTVTAMVLASKSANAFDRTFPEELTETDRTTITMGTRLNSQQRATAAYATAQANQSNLQNFNFRNDIGPSLAWGAALWLLSGSRSNPLATPLANLLYDEKEEEWLQDRNNGLFAAPPLAFLLVLGGLFVSLGVVAQFLLLQLAEGDSDVCLQLAGVSLIGGATLELGRIASGEKRATRDEMDRSTQLREEFAEFANKRVTRGGNCHRRDIVAAFRRYFAKYRQADSEEFPLTDLEIEQLLRSWNQIENGGRAEMTSSGFYYGIQINKDADVFVVK